MKVLLIAIGLIAGTAMAEENLATDRGAKRSFCSAYTTGGQWAFGYGAGTVKYQCYRVRRYLALNSRWPIRKMNSGKYNARKRLTVKTKCFGRRTVDRGFGENLVRRAFKRAQLSGASYCLFDVDN